jgi:hypothetical protein
MAKDDRMQSGILGDINPKPGTEEPVASKKHGGVEREDQESMVGGSRNLRQGAGPTGGDLGSRPE